MRIAATVNAALRANVVVHTIDARGLVAQAPLGDATRSSPGGIGTFNGQIANAATANFQRSQDSLYALARGTGGKAMFDYNDLSLGIVQAAESMSSYYLIGYYTKPKSGSGYQKVSVAVKNPEFRIRARQGYSYGD